MIHGVVVKYEDVHSVTLRQFGTSTRPMLRNFFPAFAALRTIHTVNPRLITIDVITCHFCMQFPFVCATHTVNSSAFTNAFCLVRA